MSNVFAHDGTAIFSGVWTAITAAKGFDELLLSIPKDATHWVRYTTGATAALSTGEALEGGTSGATCKLVAQAVEVGTAGSSDTGILFVNTVSGTFEAETLTGGTSTGTVDIIQDMIALNKGNPHPKAVLITVETATILCTIGGVLAATTATQNYGLSMSAGTSRVIRGVQNIRNFKAINAVNANGGILKYELYY
jgi:hypothetical protein